MILDFFRLFPLSENTIRLSVYVYGFLCHKRLSRSQIQYSQLFILDKPVNLWNRYIKNICCFFYSVVQLFREVRFYQRQISMNGFSDLMIIRRIASLTTKPASLIVSNECLFTDKTSFNNVYFIYMCIKTSKLHIYIIV